MYYINERLVRGVSQLWGMTRKEFSAFAMGSAQLYAQRMTLWSRLTVNDIIKIANATHIPMRHFLVQNEKGYVPKKKEDIVFKGEWQDITINIHFIEYVYKHDDIYSRAGIKKSMGVTEVAFYNWFHGNCNMKAQQACDFCNYFGCDLKNIINDPNDLLPGVTTDNPEEETVPDVEDKDMLPIEKRQQELEIMVANLTKQMGMFYEELKEAKEEAAVANAKLKAATTIRRPNEYVRETIEEYGSLYKWQASKWSDDTIPSLAYLVKYCNDIGDNILRYITKENASTLHDSSISINNKHLATLLHLTGKDYDLDTILVSQFCSMLNECKLSPAGILDADYLKPTFPDKMLHMIANH